MSNSSQYLEFKNKGEVPVNAFKLLGASTKRGDNSKIGFFGTGLKYAIAVLLRESVDFKVFIGEKELKIATRTTDFAGQKIKVMTVNGEKTSITIDAGINWEPWFAIREIYSNTIDEDGIMEMADEVKGTAGYTTIYLEISNKLGDVSKNWKHYFAFKRDSSFADDKGNRILPKLKDNRFTVFRKGIRVYYQRRNSLFDYDIQELSINESRVAEHDWQARQRCAEVLAVCEDISTIQTFVDYWKNQKDEDSCIEYDADFWTYLFDDFSWKDKGSFSEAWYEVLKGKRIVPIEQSGFYGVTRDTIAFPEKLITHLHKHFGDRLNLIGHSKERYLIVSDYDNRLDNSLSLLERYGFGFDRDNIKIAKFRDEDIIGSYDQQAGLVLISEKALAPVHKSKLTNVLFEEIAHAKSGYSDNTRAFQDYIIDIAINLMEVEK